MPEIDFHALNPWFVVAFVAVGMMIVAGVLLQALAIVRQSKSLFGMLLKFAALGSLIALVVQVRQNAIPYVIVFMVSALISLMAASLARQRLLR